MERPVLFTPVMANDKLLGEFFSSHLKEQITEFSYLDGILGISHMECISNKVGEEISFGSSIYNLECLNCDDTYNSS